MLTRSYKEGVHPPALDNVGGFQQGQVAIYDVTNPTSGDFQAKLPTGAAPWLQAPFGLCDSAGFVGGSGSALGEALSFARQGLWRALLTGGQSYSLSRGQEFIADASTLGNIQPRTPYSFSAYVLGVSEEAYGPTSTNDLVEVYLQPYLKEVVRQISGSTLATVAANTRFFGGPGVALNAAQIPLYRARFTGEVIRNLSAYCSVATGGGDTLVFTVQKSSDKGATFSDTALTCTIGNSATTASDLTDAVTLNAGDVLAVKMVSNGSTAQNPGFTFDVT